MDALVTDEALLRQAQHWMAEGARVRLLTVVQTWGSAPRQPGAMLVLCDDGRFAGSVSGGCIEDDLVARAREGRLPDTSESLDYGLTADEAAQFGLPCGGVLRLVCEPLTPDGWVAEALDHIHAQRLMRRHLTLATGQVRWEPAALMDQPDLADGVFQAIVGPRWRLLIIGANQTAQALAVMAQMLEFQVLVCDPRADMLAQWPMSGVTTLSSMPDDAVLDIGTDVRTAIVALTHDPKLDDMALLEALKSPAFYVGALGSRKNQEKRRERLRYFDMSDDEIARLRGPVGLPIGSRTPAEIAVAIAAQLVQQRQLGLLGAPASSAQVLSSCALKAGQSASGH